QSDDLLCQRSPLSSSSSRQLRQGPCSSRQLGRNAMGGGLAMIDSADVTEAGDTDQKIIDCLYREPCQVALPAPIRRSRGRASGITTGLHVKFFQHGHLSKEFEMLCKVGREPLTSDQRPDLNIAGLRCLSEIGGSHECHSAVYHDTLRVQARPLATVRVQRTW